MYSAGNELNGDCIFSDNTTQNCSQQFITFSSSSTIIVTFSTFTVMIIRSVSKRNIFSDIFHLKNTMRFFQDNRYFENFSGILHWRGLTVNLWCILCKRLKGPFPHLFAKSAQHQHHPVTSTFNEWRMATNSKWLIDGVHLIIYIHTDLASGSNLFF